MERIIREARPDDMADMMTVMDAKINLRFFVRLLLAWGR